MTNITYGGASQEQLKNFVINPPTNTKSQATPLLTTQKGKVGVDEESKVMQNNKFDTYTAGGTGFEFSPIKPEIIRTKEFRETQDIPGVKEAIAKKEQEYLNNIDKKYMSKDRLSNIVETAKQNGDDPEMIINDILSKGYIIEGFEQKIKDDIAKKYEQEKSQGLLGGIREMGQDLLSGLSESAQAGRKIAQNLAKETFVQGGKLFGYNEEELRKSAEGSEKKIDVSGLSKAIQPESERGLTYDVSKFVGDVTQTVAPGMGISKGISKIPQLAKPGFWNTVGKGALIGAVETPVYTAIADQKLPTGGEMVAGGAAGGVAGGVAGGAIKGLKKIISTPTEYANYMLQNMNRITKGKQQKFAQQYGESVGEFLNKRGIISGAEDTVEELGKRFSNSKAQADKGLEAIKGNFKNDTLGTILEDSAGFASRTRNKEAKRLNEMLQKHSDEGLTMTEINKVKRFFEKNNKMSYYKSMNGEKVAEATNLDNALREWQFGVAKKNGFDNLADINKQTSAYKFLINEIGSNFEGFKGNNLISLTDYISMSGALPGPTALGILAGKKFLGSNRVSKNIVKLLNKIGKLKTIDEKIVDINNINTIVNSNLKETQINKLLDDYLKYPALPSPKATVIPEGGLPQVKAPIKPTPRTKQIVEKPLSSKTVAPTENTQTQTNLK